MTDISGTHTTTNKCSWRVLSASECGTSHKQRGQPCQDAHRWVIQADAVLVAVVADGAGSASLGEVGAAIAAKTAVEAVSSQKTRLHFSQKDDEGWHILLTDALKSARIAVEEEAAARQVMLKHLATTLILVIATPEIVAVAQIGDGAAVVTDGRGSIVALTKPQVGEYANYTTFLTSPNALEMAHVCLWPETAAHLAIFSDGLQMLALKMPEGIPHVPFFSPLFRFMADITDESEAEEQLIEFLNSPRVTERTDDDLTLFLATLVNET